MDRIDRASGARNALLLFMALAAWSIPAAAADQAPVAGSSPSTFEIKQEDAQREPADVPASPTTPPDAAANAGVPPSSEPVAAEPEANRAAQADVHANAADPPAPAEPVVSDVQQKHAAADQGAERASSDCLLPWGPGTPSPELDAIARRAEETARYGFNLAERGALYSSRGKFIEALRTIAQALDAQRNTTAHTRALAAGLRAIEEVDDFVPRGDRLETDLNFPLIVDAHRTPILKSRSLHGLTAAQAQRAYLTYAQEQLAAAGADQDVASLALHGLGKICTTPAEMHGPCEQISEAKAVTFHQAALIVEPQNFMAANEVGVLLVRCGRLDEACLALEHAVAISAAPTPWRNLVAVYQRLGQPDRAAVAQQQFNSAVARLQNAGHTGAGAKYPIEWVDPATFAQNNSMIADPSPPQPVKSESPSTTASQSEKKTRSNLRR